MCFLTPAKELAIREAIRSEIETLGVPTFSRRRLISSKQDFYAKLGTLAIGNKTEVRFVQMDLINFTDLVGEGIDDCPPVRLAYRLHVFFQFADLRSDDSNSTDDFIKFCLDLRHLINELDEVDDGDGRKHSIGKLTQTSDILTDNDSIADVTGHYAEFLVEVDVFG